MDDYASALPDPLAPCTASAMACSTVIARPIDRAYTGAAVTQHHEISGDRHVAINGKGSRPRSWSARTPKSVR